MAWGRAWSRRRREQRLSDNILESKVYWDLESQPSTEEEKDSQGEQKEKMEEKTENKEDLH